MLLPKLEGTQDITTTLVYGILEVMHTCGLEVDNANSEIMINSIEDLTMKKLWYKRGQDSEDLTTCISDRAPSKELGLWCTK